MPTTIWNAKDPDETVRYVSDWADQLGSDTIASYVMTPTGTATIAKELHEAQRLTFWIEGGTDTTTTTFLLTVTTDSGQVLERAYSLLVTSGADSFRPTSTTKRMLVEQMFGECGMNGWELDIQAEEKDKALSRLDALMWELLGRGIDINYNFPAGIGQGNLDDDLGCPDQAFFGLATLGAERLCPTMGKTMKPESRMALTAAMKAVRGAAAVLVPSMQLAPGTPLGSGGQPWRQRFSV